MTFRTFVYVILACVFCFVLGILASVWKYQTAHQACVDMIAPFDCTTDTDCINEEERRFEQLKRSL